MHKSEVIHFYPATISSFHHFLYLAMVTILILLDLISGTFGYIIYIAPISLVQLYLFIRSRYPCITIGDEGIAFTELPGTSCTRFYAWSELIGEPKQCKYGVELTIKYPRLGPSTVMIPTNYVGADDRLRIYELIRKSIPPEEMTFKCFQCGAQIETHENACSKCGWTWC